MERWNSNLEYIVCYRASLDVLFNVILAKNNIENVDYWPFMMVYIQDIRRGLQVDNTNFSLNILEIISRKRYLYFKYYIFRVTAQNLFQVSLSNSWELDNCSTILKQNVILTIKSYRNSKMSYNFKYIIVFLLQLMRIILPRGQYET